MKKRTLIILLIYFTASSLLELAAFKLGGTWSVAAAWLWLFTGLAVLGFFVFEILRMLFFDFKEKHFVTPLVFLAFIGVFVYHIASNEYSDINADAAQQLAAGLDSFKKADLNYTGVAFLGYPNRQYVLAALPALLFGRKIWTLHAGFGILFIIGISYLYYELRQWLKTKEMREEYALIPLFSFPVFNFITEYYMNFEQAITPVALSAILCALYLRLMRKPDAVTFVMLSWAGCFTSGSYTPALALLGLLVAFLGLCAFECIWNDSDDKEEKEGDDSLKWQKPVLCLAVIINVSIVFLAGFITGRADRIDQFRNEGNPVKSAFKTWSDFFTDKNEIFLGVFWFIIIIYMILALLMRFTVRDFVIAVWVLGVVFMSEHMKGYTTYQKAWILQRNMLIIPVLVTAIFIVCMNFLKKFSPGINLPLMVAILGALAFLGIGNFGKQHRSFTYFRYVQPVKYLIEDIYDSLEEYGLNERSEFAVVLYTDNHMQANLYDYAKFFFPNAVIYSESGTVYDNRIDASVIEGRTVFFYAEDERFDYLEPGTEDSAVYYSLLEKKNVQKKYKNKRYGVEHTWYHKVI